MTDKAKEAVEALKEKGKEYAEQVKEKGKEYMEKGQEKGKEYMEKGQEFVEKGKEKGFVEAAKDKVKDVYEKGKEMGQEFVEAAKEKISGKEHDSTIEQETFTSSREGPSYGQKAYGVKEKEDYEEGFNEKGKGKKEVKEKEGEDEGWHVFSSSYMVTVDSNSSWDSLKDSEKPIIMEFFKQDCAECKRIYPKLIDKAKKHHKGKWVLAGADMGKDGVKPIAKNLKVSDAPTIVLVHKGRVIDHMTGHDEAQLDKMFDKVFNELLR